MYYKKRVMGIDPGKHIGVAYIDNNGEFHAKSVIANAVTWRDFLTELLEENPGEWRFFFEDVPSTVGRGRAGSPMFNFGRSCGIAYGVLIALSQIVVMVRPVKWMKFFGVRRGNKTTREWKNELKELAGSRRPEIRGRQLTLKTSDAVLIMEWGLFAFFKVAEVSYKEDWE